jgi:hypothetical protein
MNSGVPNISEESARVKTLSLSRSASTQAVINACNLFRPIGSARLICLRSEPPLL